MMRIRRGARIVLREKDGRFLLFHFSYDAGPLAGTDYWGLPGGGVEEGETVPQAAVRELREETGVIIEDPGVVVGTNGYDFRLCTGERVREEDAYFVVDAPPELRLSREGFTPEESLFMRECRWWSLEELRTTSENIVPADLPLVLERAGIF